MSAKQSVVRKAIPLCGIVLVLGVVSCGRLSFYSAIDRSSELPQQVEASGAAQQELVTVVQEFLKNVPNNQRSTFDQFFADDVIYTRGTGQVVAKKDILADIGNPSVPRANANFAGEDFNVHQYGDMAVVNFRLVMHAIDNDKPLTRSFRNTGTFIKHNGRWQAIAWQATPIADQK